MKKFSIAALAKIIRAHIGEDTSHEPRVTSHNFTGVSTDSRTAKTGDCFFAIAGEHFDGHDYISDAFARGAVCAVVSKNRAMGHVPRGTVLRVADTIKALGDFARWYRRQNSFKVVAITGSVGKTTTRQIAYQALSQHYRVFQAPKNFNNNIGLPLTLLGADPGDEVVIVELGSNHPGEIAYLTRIALPEVAVVTNVYPAHLEGLGDLQAIAREKLSIAEGLQPNGVLIINADLVKWLNGDLLNYQLPVTDHQILTFGKSRACDYRMRDISFDGFGSNFVVDGTQISLPVPGLGNVENAVAAWAVCSQFGLTIDDFVQAVKTLKTIPMRVELLRIGTLTVLNDCYNANPASMKNALNILTNSDSTVGRRLVFICGDMAELGQQSQALHADLGASIAQAKVQVLLAVGKFAKTTAEAAKRTADYDLQTICFEDILSICDNLQEFIKDYDMILVKGSRTAKLEMAVEKLKQLYKGKLEARNSKQIKMTKIQSVLVI